MGEERENRLFPDKEQEDQKILCHDITPDFLIYGTDVRMTQNYIHIGSVKN